MCFGVWLFFFSFLRIVGEASALSCVVVYYSSSLLSFYCVNITQFYGSVLQLMGPLGSFQFLVVTVLL